MNITELLIGNDMILELEGLTNGLTGEVLNDATVAVTLLDAEGGEVGGDVWPKTMAYVAESLGVYHALLVYTLALEAGNRYNAEVTVDAGAGLRASWTVECIARQRG